MVLNRVSGEGHAEPDPFLEMSWGERYGGEHAYGESVSRADGA
ncbi:hypothetical protein [Micromonospora sp. NPDC049107]